jgi:Flp pilus assembly protein TadD
VNNELSDARSNLGLSLVRQGRLQEAIVEFDAALHVNPNDAFAHYNKGVALAQLGETEEAIAQMREALRLDPGDEDAERDLARLLARPDTR